MQSILQNASLTKEIRFLILIVTGIFFTIGCKPENKTSKYTIEVYQTSAAGDNLKLITKEDLSPSNTNKTSIKLTLNPEYYREVLYPLHSNLVELNKDVK